MPEREARPSNDAAGPETRSAGGAPDQDADRLPLDCDQIRALTTATASGGLVVFPAETVYGIAADPDDADAVRRMAELKQRDPAKPSSVLFWSVEDALDALDGAPDSVLRAVGRLLPGPVGLIVPNPQRRFGPACGDDPTTLGIRVPRLAVSVTAHPIVQTSANLAGGPDPTTLAAVPAAVREGADLLLDAGERPGTPSTIVDLRGVTDATPDGWRIVREGPVTADAIAAALAAG